MFKLNFKLPASAATVPATATDSESTQSSSFPGLRTSLTRKPVHAGLGPGLVWGESALELVWGESALELAIHNLNWHVS